LRPVAKPSKRPKSKKRRCFRKHTFAKVFAEQFLAKQLKEERSDRTIQKERMGFCGWRWMHLGDMRINDINGPKLS